MKALIIFLLSFILLTANFSLNSFAQVSEKSEKDTDSIKTLTVLTDDLLTIEDPAPQLSTEGRIPLIMVHGWNFDGKPARPGTEYWNYHLNYILNDPDLSKYFKPYYVKYWSNAITVHELGGLLRDKIQLAGLHEKPFILLAHSMGGLVSRSFMTEYTFTEGKFAGLPCGDMAKLLITLGTPHHGSPMANGPARDDKVNILLKLCLSAVETFIFSDIKYNEANRSDLRWDNYDNLLNYTKYPSERNDWLTNLNTHTEYDSKMICYAATVTGQLLFPPYNSIEEDYKVGAYLLKQSFGFNNDGIVPFTSATFEGHSPKKIRTFNEYNHTDIAKGKGDETILFTSIKEDLMELLPPRLIWPTDSGLFLKYSTVKEIKWEAPSSVQAVNLYFSGDNGNTFIKLADHIDATSGSFQWSVPDTNLTQCIIRITKATDETKYTQSDNYFTIYHNRLTFTNPLTRSYFVPDKQNSISWNQTGIAKQVQITYSDSRNGINKVITEQFSTVQSLNNYNWLLDHSIPPVDSAKIIIKMIGMKSIGDAEDYTFISPSFTMLGSPNITITKPSGNPTDIDGIPGEKLIIGSNSAISWQTEGEIKFVKISLCDSLKNILQLVKKKNQLPGIHATGLTSWKIPELYGNKFYLLLEAGTDENNITATTYCPFPFRINRQLEILSPENNANTINLLPCFSVALMDKATNYYYETSDSATGGLDYHQTFTSSTPEFCFSNTPETELLAGTVYQLRAWAIFDTVKSYGSQLFFKTSASIPDSFKTVLPVNADTLWDDSVSFAWNRSLGANSYLFELIYHKKVISTKTTGRTDTTITIRTYKNGYIDTLFWKVTASNDYGKTYTSGYFFNKDRVGTRILKTTLDAFGLTCYPDPIANHAVFKFNIPDSWDNQKVSLSIYTLTGQKVVTLINHSLNRGIHQVTWERSNSLVRKGIYFSILDVNGKKEVKKIRIE